MCRMQPGERCEMMASTSMLLKAATTARAVCLWVDGVMLIWEQSQSRALSRACMCSLGQGYGIWKSRVQDTWVIWKRLRSSKHIVLTDLHMVTPRVRVG